MKNTFITTLIILLFVPSYALSNPVIEAINGIASHNNEIQIFGYSFGNKDMAQPVLFETFESLSAGSDIGDEGFWSIRFDGYDDCTYNDTNLRYSNAGNNGKVVLTYNEKKGAFYKENIWGQGIVGRKFISAWVYINFDNLVDSDRWQLKLWRVSTGPDHTDYIGSAYETWWTTSGDRDGYGQYYEHVGTPYGQPGSMSMRAYPGQWFRVQWEWEDSSSVGASDGKVRLTNIFPDRDERIYLARDNFVLRTATYPNPVSTPKFGYLIENSTTGQGVTTYWDDIYVDNGWSRVEIGNSPTYDTSTQREMQIPTSWTDSSISLTVNSGAFSPGETVYLYVADADGIVNDNGYPVVLGESQVGSLPTTTTPSIPATYDYGSFSLQQPSYTVDRSSGYVYLTISRLDGSDGEVSVQWSSNGETAFHGVDYYGADNVTVNFADGETSKQIAIELIQNGATDDRTFSVSLSNAADGAALGSVTSTRVTILGTGSIAPPPTLRIQ